MKIGCVSFVNVDGKIVAINCAKGRGFILPGGKMEPGETFKETAARELFEETGLVAVRQKLIFQAPSGGDEYFVLCFKTQVEGYCPRDSREGTVTLVDWQHLLQSNYKGYYELLRDVINVHQTPI